MELIHNSLCTVNHIAVAKYLLLLKKVNPYGNKEQK